MLAPDSPALGVVGRLEAIVEAAPELPFGLGVRVDQEALFDLIYQLPEAAARKVAPR